MNDINLGQFLFSTALMFIAFAVMGAILGVAEKWGRR